MSVLLIHAAATLMLVGLIWTIQLVHYPLMAAVGRESFSAYHERHARAITPVVGPLMLLELATGLWLVVDMPAHVEPVLAWVGLTLVLTLWALTAFVAVPVHSRLDGGYDRGLLERLVATNWWRTVAWSARGLLVLVLLAGAPTAGA